MRVLLLRYPTAEIQRRFASRYQVLKQLLGTSISISAGSNNPFHFGDKRPLNIDVRQNKTISIRQLLKKATQKNQEIHFRPCFYSELSIFPVSFPAFINTANDG
ncbi:MAG: hypothetical protein C4516_10155 [Oxalobacter sp.]|nr:MAG: hypothetical protein C4516_10155 [Oxalobacter sp.]